MIASNTISYTYPVYVFEKSSNSYEIIESNIVTNNTTSGPALVISGSSATKTIGSGEDAAVVVYGDKTKEELYNSALQNINNEISKAEQAYKTALNKLNEQVDKIQDCTTWAEEDKLKQTYEFNPEIRFDYAEEEYISMMNGNNQLQPESEFDSTTLGYFCEDNKETVVETGSCPNSVSDDKTITVKVPNNSIESATESSDEVYLTLLSVALLGVIVTVNFSFSPISISSIFSSISISVTAMLLGVLVVALLFEEELVLEVVLELELEVELELELELDPEPVLEPELEPDPELDVLLLLDDEYGQTPFGCKCAGCPPQ